MPSRAAGQAVAVDGHRPEWQDLKARVDEVYGGGVRKTDKNKTGELDVKELKHSKLEATSFVKAGK